MPNIISYINKKYLNVDNRYSCCSCTRNRILFAVAADKKTIIDWFFLHRRMRYSYDICSFKNLLLGCAWVRSQPPISGYFYYNHPSTNVNM